MTVQLRSLKLKGRIRIVASFKVLFLYLPEVQNTPSSTGCFSDKFCTGQCEQNLENSPLALQHERSVKNYTKRQDFPLTNFYIKRCKCSGPLLKTA
jgi:hypothetical protein